MSLVDTSSPSFSSGLTQADAAGTRASSLFTQEVPQQQPMFEQFAGQQVRPIQ